MNTGRIALQLDELLCDLTPDQAAALRAALPTGFRDQLDAAATHTRQSLAAATAAGVLTRHAPIPTADHPAWIRLGITDTLVRWHAGSADTCMHAPHPLRPRPVFAAAWRPGLVVCGACGHLLAIPPDSDTDRTCDGCGKVTAGPAHDDPIYPLTIVCGALTYQAGACRDCQYVGQAGADHDR
ncbi:hypothetical protein [Actinomadura opuntiae]|uniref:hypothetical protein n=1 Tax=Actinomadura sp. OS1-43 TaxID=604315 RepID=UPI00255A922F|nr:hypothetical protein [Actinomadura sp. OS1-43]MDL4815478.1 hypothetical protein [Actinomadura sp. OS1-43]